MSDHQSAPTTERLQAFDGVSRRSFLVASGGVVAVSGAAVKSGDRMVPRDPSEIVLTDADLLAPVDDRYTLVSNDAAESKLLTRLGASLSGFRHGSTAVSGFAATDGSAVPKYVESSAVALPDSIAPGALAAKSAEWLAERFDATDTLMDLEHDQGQFVEEWRSKTEDGWQDVFRVVHAGDGTVLFAVVYGRDDADFTASAAVDHYDRTMRERAFEPAD